MFSVKNSVEPQMFGWICSIYFFWLRLMLFCFVLSNANKQIWPIRPLHLSTNVLVAQNAHQYCMYKSKIILFYPRHTARRTVLFVWVDPALAPQLKCHLSSPVEPVLMFSHWNLLGYNLYSVLKDTHHTSNTAKGPHATPGLKWAFYNFFS